MKDLKYKVDNLIANPVENKEVGIVKLQMVREEKTLYGGKKFDSPEDAYEIVKTLFEKADREMLVVMSLSSKLEPLSVEVVAIGGLTSCGVDVKNIFKHAILSNSGSIIIFHNHPSGVSMPSTEDCKITKRIKKAGAILDIELLDHIVVGKDEYYSFNNEQGWSQDL